MKPASLAVVISVQNLSFKSRRRRERSFLGESDHKETDVPDDERSRDDLSRKGDDTRVPLHPSESLKRPEAREEVGCSERRRKS